MLLHKNWASSPSGGTVASVEMKGNWLFYCALMRKSNCAVQPIVGLRFCSSFGSLLLQCISYLLKYVIVVLEKKSFEKVFYYSTYIKQEGKILIWRILNFNTYKHGCKKHLKVYNSLKIGNILRFFFIPISL